MAASFSSSTSDISAFCAQQRTWLEEELHAEESASSSAAAADRTSTAQAEAQQTKQNVLHHLEASEISVGLYGRTVVRFTTTAADNSGVRLLPAHRLTTGDEVEIRSSNKRSSSSTFPAGVVSAVTEDSLSVALFSASRKKQKQQQDDNDDDEDDLLGNPPYSLLPRSNVEVHRKLVAALAELEKHGVNHPVAGRIVQALFEAPAAPSGTATPLHHGMSPQQPYNPNLDDSQLEAIQFALATPRNQPVVLIHGPPGTGKTTTIVELIRQAVHQHQWKVLVTAPSNVAVDNVLARLVEQPQPATTTTGTKPPRRKAKKAAAAQQQRLRVVRLGHPARLQPAILPYSLEALVQGAEGTEIVADVRAELESHLKILTSSSNRQKKGGGDAYYSQRRLAYREVKALRQEIRQREEKTVQDLLDHAQVVLSTCVGAANHKLLNEQQFDLVVIDEAAQALEAACWIPALRARTKLVLAGDHCQLPPTIQSPRAEVQRGLGCTMFERVLALYGDNDATGSKTGTAGRVSRMLRVQYRMHEQISDWASQALYGGALQTHASVARRTLADLSCGGAASSETSGGGRPDEPEGEEEKAASASASAPPPLLLLDTAGCAFYEAENAAGSRYNDGEAALVERHVRHLICGVGVPPAEIAVISPYNGQVEVLRLALLPDFPNLQIKSVDGFQGGEREAVVISLVRSSDSRGGGNGIGFLKDDRRLNVAVTRAKRHCCIVCDTETVRQSAFIENLIDWVEEHGEQRSALEVNNADEDAAAAGQFDADLALAELELERLMREEAKKAYSTQQKKNNGSTTATERKAVSPAEIERRREALLEKIRGFQFRAQPGDEMVMSTELSKLDRKLVHEIAEELGLHHQSDGVEGVDRRIKLCLIPSEDDDDKMEENAVPTVPFGEGGVLASSTAAAAATQSTNDNNEDGNVVVDDDDVFTPEDIVKPAASAFPALEEDDDDNIQSQDEDDAGEKADGPAMNSVLSDLAKERAQRERQRQQQQQQQESTAAKKKKPKKKGRRLGVAKKVEPKQQEDKSLDDLDDMAFLDAQINKVQTSHGRQIDARGSNYRTIMNGVLLAKPTPTEKTKDARASSALQEKLKQAQDGRKAKTKKK